MQDTAKAMPPALRRLLMILCLTTLAALCKGSSADEPAALTSQALVGTWRLVSVEERQPDGETIYWMGRRPLGLLIYDWAGNVSVQIMRDPSLATVPANRQDGYYAYFGRYDVREREATGTAFRAACGRPRSASPTPDRFD